MKSPTMSRLPGAETSPPIGSAERCRQLENQITELAAHIHAATYRLLELIHEFDQAGGWCGPGLASCAHWLNWKCGIGMGAAREKVRVARALQALPGVSAQFRQGEISYSKVRAITRVASAENEQLLLQIARYGTAAHVERVVRQFRNTQRVEALRCENQRHALRSVEWHTDDTGCLVLKGRFTPEQGAVLQQVLERVMEEEWQERQDVSAETSRRLCCDAAVVHWLENHKGEALSIGRRSRTVPPAIRRALQRRDGGCRFPGCTHHRFVDSHHVRHWADGGETRLDNMVLLCRRHHRLVHEGGFGVEARADGGFCFTNPEGQRLPQAPAPRFRGNAFTLVHENHRNGLTITSRTGECRWLGEEMDVGLAVEGLERGQDQKAQLY